MKLLVPAISSTLLILSTTLVYATASTGTSSTIVSTGTSSTVVSTGTSSTVVSTGTSSTVGSTGTSSTVGSTGTSSTVTGTGGTTTTIDRNNLLNKNTIKSQASSAQSALRAHNKELASQLKKHPPAWQSTRGTNQNAFGGKPPGSN